MVEDRDLANFSEKTTRVKTVPRLSHLNYIMLLCKNRQQGDKKKSELEATSFMDGPLGKLPAPK